MSRLGEVFDRVAERPLVRGGPVVVGFLAVSLLITGGTEGITSEPESTAPACASENFNPINDFICAFTDLGFDIGAKIAC
jgi:hypothetical protein